MRYTTPLLALLLAALPSLLYAGVIKGRITDEKGNPLAYATIYIQGTTQGTNANGNGHYELSVAPGLYKVVCQLIGFKQSSFNVTISGSEVVEHNFVLSDQSLDMKEVVVHANAEDPAYAIVRKAIKKRKEHLDQVKSFQTDIYLKGVIRSRKMPNKFMGKKVTDETDNVDSLGRGVLYLTEEDATYYSDGDKEKTVIHSVRESGNPGGVGFSQFPSVISFYENNVNIFGGNNRGFISPISENALNYYKYKLLGEYREEGHTINKIQVIQKRNYEPCFNGIIYIADDDWAIHSLNMVLAKQSGMDIVDTLKIDQIYVPTQKDEWIIKSQVLYFTVNLMGFDVTASGVTVYNKQRINAPIPDSIFASKITSVYDKTANKKDTTYWKDRPIPLEQDEQRDYVIKDSLREKFTNPAYLDSMRRRNNRFKPIGFLAGGYSFATKKNKNRFSTNNVLLGLGEDNMVNYNTVEGLNVAPKINWTHMVDTGKYLIGDVALRYGFSNTHFNAIGRLYYFSRNKAWRNRTWLYGAEGGKYVFQYNPANPVSQYLNTFYALLARENDLKIYERWEASAFVNRDYGNGFVWYGRISYQQRLPLENTTYYTFFKGDMASMATNAVPNLVSAATAWEKHDAVIFSAAVSYKPGFTYTQYPDYKVANGSRWPRFTLAYQKGIPNILNSKTDFDKWRFSIQDAFNMKLAGSLRYNVAVGGFLNTNYVSIPDLNHLVGNRGIGIAAPYLQSFQMAQFYEFSNKEQTYYEGHLEYHLNGLLSNKIPLLRQARFYLLFGGNAYYASDKTWYTEAFVGIDNIGWKLARFLRVDFVQSWDSHLGRNFGIRFGLNAGNISTTSGRNNATRSEW